MPKQKKCFEGYACKEACISKLDDCKFLHESKVIKALLNQYQTLIEKHKKNLKQTAKNNLDINFIKFAELMENATDEQAEAIGKLYGSLISIPQVDRTGVKLPPLDSIEEFMEKGGIEKYSKAYKNSFKDGEFTAEGTKEYINTVAKRIKIDDNLSNAVYATLPKAVKIKLNIAGRPRGGYWTGEDETGQPIIGKRESAKRGKILLKRYLEQNGIDPYTNKFVNINEAEVEHIVPEDKAGRKADQPNNWMWIDIGVNKWHSDLDDEEWKANGNEKLSNKDKYVSDREKAIVQANVIGKKVVNIGEHITKTFDLETSPQERQEYIKNVAESMKNKAKKLLSGAGLPGSFRQIRIEPGKVGNHWTFPPDTRQTTFQHLLKDKFGNQKVSSLVAQALAFTAGTNKQEELKAEYTRLNKNRQMTKEEGVDFFKKNGKEAYNEELKKRDLEFGQGLRQLLDSIPDFS